MQHLLLHVRQRDRFCVIEHNGVQCGTHLPVCKFFQDRFDLFLLPILSSFWFLGVVPMLSSEYRLFSNYVLSLHNVVFLLSLKELFISCKLYLRSSGFKVCLLQ